MSKITPPVKDPLLINWYFIVEADKDYPKDKIYKYLYKCTPFLYLTISVLSL